MILKILFFIFFFTAIISCSKENINNTLLSSDIENIVSHAFSGEILDNYFGKGDIPSSVVGFLEQNTGSTLIGRIPYWSEKGEILEYEYFIKCSDNKYCASFYGNYRIRKGASPSMRLTKMLDSENNKYFHSHYALNQDTGKVVSLDPYDSDITNFEELEKRMSILTEGNIDAITQLVHERYYLSGALSDIGSLKLYDNSGSTLKSFTGVLERQIDTTKIPTELSWEHMDIHKPYTDISNIRLCYDGYEKHIFNETGHIVGNIENRCGQEIMSQGEYPLKYITLAQIYGSFNFDRIMSRTSGIIYNETPWKFPCLTLECPEDKEFVYGLE